MGLLDNLSGRLENLRSDNKLHQSGDINAAQVALRTAGETIGAVGDVALAPIAAATPDIIKKGLMDVVGGVMNTGPAKAALAWGKKNPEAARDILTGMDAIPVIGGKASSIAGRALRTYGDEATKGGLLANLDNYIKNWYGPGRDIVPGEGAKLFEDMQKWGNRGETANRFLKNEKLAKALKEAKKITPEQADPLSLKVAGAKETASKGIRDMIRHQLSPSSRALYGEQGITRPQQDIIAGHLTTMQEPKHLPKTPAQIEANVKGFKGDKNPAYDSRALTKGVAEVQYGTHINRQAERVGDVNPSAAEIANRSWLTDYVPNKPGSISQALNQFSTKVDDSVGTRASPLESSSSTWKTLPDVPANPNDARIVEKWMNQHMQFDEFRVKSPSSIQTGGHYSDVVNDNPANAEMRKALSLKSTKQSVVSPDGMIDLNKLATRLSERQGVSNKGMMKGNSWRVMNGDPDYIKANGLWLSGSRKGSAITEGGVGWLMKVEPDGTTTSYMVDKHDFLEKVPGFKQIGQKLLPTEVVSVTPALKGFAPGFKGRGKHFKQTPANKGIPDTMEDLLKGVVDAKASKRNVRAEEAIQYGRMAQVGGLLSAGQTED